MNTHSRNVPVSKIALKSTMHRLNVLLLGFIRLIFSGIQGNCLVMFPCDNEIFCRGDLLHAVQMARIFNDSKTFVDMRLKHNPEQTIQAFKALGPKPGKPALKTFIESYFHSPERDLIAWEPSDWKDNPAFIGKISDPKLKRFGGTLNALWKKLGRNISLEARASSNRSSLIIVDKPFIIPGGRFREYYYWDTFWTVDGLLVCEMPNTVRNMIDNFVQLVQRFGFIPNGGRIYYTNRSQPPFLIPIVELYLNYTGDFNYVKRILPDLEAEYIFWRTHRVVKVNITGNIYSLNRYAAAMNTPRPESYYEDVHTAESLPIDSKPELYRDLASAAESGWDFSTRWFGRSSKKLKSTRTRQIVPVDLNAILYRNEKTMQMLFKEAGDTAKSDQFKNFAASRRQAMEAVFWNEGKGSWLDYDLDSKSSNPEFYASCLVPLWAGLHNGNATRDKLVMDTLKTLGLFGYPGGLPTSLKESGQQWDFPNAWPPLQHFAVEAMANSKITEIKNLALQMAQKWIDTNYKAWNETGAMFEKYNVTIQGSPGGGGEYNIQVGFGWSNGVALSLLKRYPTELKVEGRHPSSMGTTLLTSFAFVVSCILKGMSLSFINF